MLKSWIPTWLTPITKSNVCFFVEESITDPRNQRLILSAKNISFSNLVEMEETCVYQASKEQDDWTYFEQQAAVTAYPWGVARKMEKFCVDSFKVNAQKGKDIMEEAIRRVKEETVPLGIATQGLYKGVLERLC